MTKQDYKKTKISIYGLGNFGYAFLKHFDKKPENFTVCGFDRNEDLIANLKKNHRHLFLHEDYQVSDNILFAHNPEELLSDCNILLLAVPSSATREIVKKLKPFIPQDLIIVNTAKALDYKTGQRLSKVINEELNDLNYRYALFAGGTIASDLFKHEPLGATIASEDKKLLNYLIEVFQSSNLRLYPSSDLVGAEYAAAFKNVVSILAGIINGMGYSYGSETHTITMVASEIENIVINHLGGKKETFAMDSQAWSNDLWMSCTGPTRNREFGILLGKGIAVDKAIAQMAQKKKTVEGINTIRILDEIVTLQDYPYLQFLHSFIIQKNVKLEKIHDIIFNS